MNRLLLCIISSIISLNSFALDYNSSDILYERVWFSTDRDVYIPGDEILISLATVDGAYMKPIQFSSIVYIEIFANDNIPVVQRKTSLANGRGSLNIVLPKKLSTNYYYIRAYTNYQKNFGAESFQVKKLRVVNPFDIIAVNESVYKQTDSIQIEVQAHKYSSDIELLFPDSLRKAGTYSLLVNNLPVADTIISFEETDSLLLIGTSNYNGRFQINWTISDSIRGLINFSRGDTIPPISFDAQTGTLNVDSKFDFGSISVVREDHGIFYDTEVCTPNPIIIPETIKYKAEIGSDLLFGSLIHISDGEVPKSVIISSPNNYDLLQVVDVTNGSFQVPTNLFNGHAELAVTPADTSSKVQVYLDNEYYSKFISISDEVYNPEKNLASFIKSLMIMVQLKEAFAFSSNIQNSPNIVFYGKYDEVVVFDNFINLPVFEDYVHELMPSAYVKKKKKRKYIRVSDYDYRGFIGNNPLVLVNGIPYLDHTSVVNLDPKTVDRVYIFNHKLDYLTNSFDGVFDVRLKEGSEESITPVSNSVRFQFQPMESLISTESRIDLNLNSTSFWTPFAESSRDTKCDIGIENVKYLLRFQGISEGNSININSPIK